MKLVVSAIHILLIWSCTRESERSIDYPGETPPGLTAEVFAPGMITTDSFEHSSPAFSPEGDVVLWTVVSRSYRASMMEMRHVDGSWSTPRRASFADTTADDYYPSFSPDGKKLFFSSRRKVPPGYGGDNGIRIWEVERKENGWGVPVPIDTIVSKGEAYAHSVTKDGTLYFSSSQGGATNWNILKSATKNGRHSKPVPLPYNINSAGYEDGPYVAADESFLIFDSQRPEGIEGSIDLYISFKSGDGWTMPMNMGPKVNSTGSERFAKLSPDGKYFFFGSTRNSSATNWGFDIFWIDASVIDELRRDESAKRVIDLPLGDEILTALYKNDVSAAADKLNQWLKSNPESLDATIVYSSQLRKLKRYQEAEQLLTNGISRWSDNVAVIMEMALVKFGINKDDEAIELLEPILAGGDQLRERYIYLSRELLEMTKFKTSDEYFEKAMAISASPYPYFSRGCAYARIGDKDKAFGTLNKAVELGMGVKKEYEDNADLASLKSDSRWKVLMEKMGR